MTAQELVKRLAELDLSFDTYNNDATLRYFIKQARIINGKADKEVSDGQIN